LVKVVMNAIAEAECPSKETGVPATPDLGVKRVVRMGFPTSPVVPFAEATNPVTAAGETLGCRSAGSATESWMMSGSLPVVVLVPENRATRTLPYRSSTMRNPETVEVPDLDRMERLFTAP
jgi:hypothetical protein